MRAGLQAKIVLAKKLPITLAPSEGVALSKISFANASGRYIEYGGLMTGPFGANVPATRVIGGKTYVQIEESLSGDSTNTEALSSVYAIAQNASWADNAGSSPVGIVNADKMCSNNSAATYHILHGGIDTSIHPHIYGIRAKAVEIHQVVLRIGEKCRGFDLSTKTTFHDSGWLVASPNADGYGFIELNDGWYFIYLYVSEIATGHVMLYLAKSGSTIFDGVTGEGVLLWGSNRYVGYYPESYTSAGATPVIRAADEAFLAAADVPSWLRTGYKKYLIPEYSSVQLAAAGTDKVLDCFVTTAETITVKLASNGKIYIDGSTTGNKFTSSVAHTWSAQQICSISVRYNNGANCVITTSGFTTGNAVQTGTAFAVANGDIYTGMTDAIAGHSNGLVSLWEPL